MAAVVLFIVLLGVLWVPAIVVCARKGKPLHAAAGIVTLPAVVGILLVGDNLYSDCPPGGGIDCELGALVGAVFWSLLTVLFLGTILAVGASRLAKPDSWWAKHRYDAEQLQAARERYGRYDVIRKQPS